MDDNLREMGVGDLSVPKRMVKFAEAFYGRTAAYDAALKAGGSELAQALARNVLLDAGSSASRAAGGLCAGGRSAASRGSTSSALLAGEWALRRAPHAGADAGAGHVTEKTSPWRAAVAVAEIPEARPASRHRSGRGRARGDRQRLRGCASCRALPRRSTSSMPAAAASASRAAFRRRPGKPAS